jgi:phosphoethanolamine N-methyltransferase
MTTLQKAAADRGTRFDNNGQYSRTGILRYEMIFGPGYISTGGHATTLDLCARLGPALRPGARVLDVGSGIGGAALYLARTYHAEVTGIDLAEEMVALALERAAQPGVAGSASFVLGDVLESNLPAPFDVIWSRDALMHIADKPRLFARLFELLAPGGRLVITDYARGKTPGSADFERYIENTGYHVIEPRAYGRLLEGAGFSDVVIEDATPRFIEILQSESERLLDRRDAFLASFSEGDLNYLLQRWAMKLRFCASRDMKWGIYLASRIGQPDGGS